MQLFDVLNLQLFKPLSGRYQRMFAELLMLIWDHCRTSTDYGMGKSEMIRLAEDFLDGADYVNAGMLLVASNEQKHYGANIIADKNMMEKISQVINDDMYILPSSVHELLILPKENAKDLGMTPKALGEMVREVNRTQVEPKERLANHVYEYNRDTKELAIVNASREKVMER